MQNKHRKIVLISGSPGAGKTTLARPLAQKLGFALITKDDIKETLFDTLNGTPGDLAFSRQIGGAAMETLWTLAKYCPSVILEANFRPHSEHERSRIAGLQGQIVEVHCRCPHEEAARRIETRAAEGKRHPAHSWTTISPDLLAEYDGPVGIGVIIEVDTTGPIDIDALILQINAAWLET